MGRGRKPTATAIKNAKGSFNRHPERRNHQEPQPKRSAPKQPASLKGDKVAQAMWRTTCKLLDDMNVLTVSDVHVIESYCLNESQMVTAQKDLKENGIGEGARLSNAFRAWSQCMDRRIKLMGELGLTPSARTRLVAVTEKEADPFLEFLNSASKN
jgi:P27 family predicted phage terminase small subunit